MADDRPPVPPLPRRQPRSWRTHALVDVAVAFLVMAFPALLLGTGALIVAGGLAIGIGVGIAGTTRAAEIRALAARDDHPASE